MRLFQTGPEPFPGAPKTDLFAEKEMFGRDAAAVPVGGTAVVPALGVAGTTIPTGVVSTGGAVSTTTTTATGIGAVFPAEFESIRTRLSEEPCLKFFGFTEAQRPTDAQLTQACDHLLRHVESLATRPELVDYLRYMRPQIEGKRDRSIAEESHLRTIERLLNSSGTAEERIGFCSTSKDPAKRQKELVSHNEALKEFLSARLGDAASKPLREKVMLAETEIFQKLGQQVDAKAKEEIDRKKARTDLKNLEKEKRAAVHETLVNRKEKPIIGVGTVVGAIASVVGSSAALGAAGWLVEKSFGLPFTNYLSTVFHLAVSIPPAWQIGLAVGAAFGIWNAGRFIRNQYKSRAKPKPLKGKRLHEIGGDGIPFSFSIDPGAPES